MKKIGVVLVLFLFLISLIVYINAQSDFDQFEDAVDKGIEDKVENLEGKIDEYTDQDKWEEKWDYLGKEWKNILLKNPVVFASDTFLKKISIVFEILLGESYSLSIGFFFLIFLWLYLLFNLSFLLKAFFSGGISWVMSFLILLLFARIGFFGKVIVVSKFLLFTLGEFISFLPLLFLVLFLIYSFLLYFFESFVRNVRAYYLRRMRHFRDVQRERDEAMLHSIVRIITGENRPLLSSSERKLLPAPKPKKLSSKNKKLLSYNTSSDTKKDSSAFKFSNINEALKKIGSAKTKKEAKSFYLRAAKQFHPDKGGSNGDMRELNVVYAPWRNKT